MFDVLSLLTAAGGILKLGQHQRRCHKPPPNPQHPCSQPEAVQDGGDALGSVLGALSRRCLQYNGGLASDLLPACMVMPVSAGWIVHCAQAGSLQTTGLQRLPLQHQTSQTSDACTCLVYSTPIPLQALATNPHSYAGAYISQAWPIADLNHQTLDPTPRAPAGLAHLKHLEFGC